MKNLSKIALFSLTILFTYACSEKTSKTENVEATESIETTADKVTLENDFHSNVLDGYLNLKNALVETNGQEAQEIALNLSSILSTNSNTELEIIKEEIKKISETTDTEVQRDAFDLLSAEVLEMVKTSKLTSGKLYKQYCPMAKNNQGAFWLSTSMEIRNPYFGDKMLTCGSVEEEI